MKMKTYFWPTMFMASMADPTRSAPAIGLLFHLLSGGDHDVQGFYGHVIGGMGSITQALAQAGPKAGRGNQDVGKRGRNRR